MGSELRFDYSALGDAVNVSARIQSFSGNYNFAICVGDDTEEIVKDSFTFLELDYIKVKGRATPTHIYALMGHPHVRETKAFQVLNDALQTLHRLPRPNWAAKEAIAKGRAIPGAPEPSSNSTKTASPTTNSAEPPPWAGMAPVGQRKVAPRPTAISMRS
jgi:adenylate cyclase